MKLKRHKSFLKDWRKVSLSDEFFEKFIAYSNALKSNIPLPKESWLLGRILVYKELSL